MSNLTDFSTGGIKSIQRGTVAISAGQTTGTATITSVNTAKAELRLLGASAAYLTDSPRIALTNSTTITATCYTAAQNVSTASWELTEYY